MTGEPTSHLDIRSNVDEHGNWKGPKTSEAQGGETLGIPNNLGGGKPKAGVSTGGESLGIPEEAAKQLQPGHVTTFANGQKWTLKGGKPVLVSSPQGQ